MERSGLNQPQLAKAASTRDQKVSQQVIQQILTGRNQSSKFTPTIARALGVRAEWLAEGIGPMEAQVLAVATVPVISRVQAGDWKAHVSHGQFERQIGCDTKVSSQAFALEIAGQSMLPRFQEGDVVIIDPAIEPVPGDFVVARLDGEGETTFKQFRIKSHSPKIIELYALNELFGFHTLENSRRGMIIGPMVEHHSYRP